MYSRTIRSQYFRLLLVSLGSLILSSCKYIELYKFSQQFCDVDEYIKISLDHNSTNVFFNTPTLSRTLLLRYLGANPIHSRHSAYESGSEISGDFISRDHFEIEQMDDPKQNFEFFLHYHELSKQSLLQQAHLDPSLSKLFNPDFIVPIVASFCTDDYDIEDEYVDLRFQLDSVPDSLPSKSQLLAVFGTTQDASNNSYLFRFSQQTEIAPEKHIFFQFTFDTSEKERLTKLYIKYYRYDYQLDFNTGAGRLIVSR